jgi:hypothetical protein
LKKREKKIEFILISVFEKSVTGKRFGTVKWAISVTSWLFGFEPIDG